MSLAPPLSWAGPTGLPVHHLRNISAWIGVRSRNLLNICENDILKSAVFIVTKNSVEFCLK